MKRIKGYYWVLNDCLDGAKWMVANWDGKCWSLPGNEWDLIDRDLLEIKEDRLQEPE